MRADVPMGVPEFPMTSPKPADVDPTVRAAALHGDVTLRGLAKRIQSGDIKNIVAVCGAWSQSMPCRAWPV